MAEATAAAGSGALRHVVGKAGLFVLAMGGMVGSAWVVILGSWLQLAGPAGAVIGICAGAVAMAVIALSYAELMSRMPVAGGEMVYTFEVFGTVPSFLVGWISILPLIGNVIFEGIALTWMISALAPSLGGVVLYHAFGYGVTAAQLGIGVIVTIFIAVQNYIGIRNAVLLQSLLTGGFFLIALFAVFCGLALGHSGNLQPLFIMDAKSPWWVGAGSIFATGVVWFAGGFQGVPQVIEERTANVSFAAIAKVMVIAIVLAAVFYSLAIVSVSMAKPWPGLLHENLVTAAALHDLLPGGILSSLVLVSGGLAVLRLWNGGFVVASRLVMVMARANFLPHPLVAIHPKYGTPHRVIVLLTIVNIGGIFLGAGAIMPILNTCSICMAITIFMAIIALIAIRRRGGPPAAYPVPGGAFTIAAGLASIVFLGGATIVTPYLHAKGGIPFEWEAFLVWSAVGLAYLGAQMKRLKRITYAETRAALLEERSPGPVLVAVDRASDSVA